MSAVNTAIYSYLQGISALTALVGTRMYADANKQAINPNVDTKYPYIVWSKVSSVHEHHQGGAAGLASERYEFDVHSLDALQAETVGDELRKALDGLHHTTMGSASLDVRSVHLQTEDSGAIRLDNKTIEFIVRLDFILVHAETVPVFP